MNINISNFSKEELITAIKPIKNNKLPSSDKAITAEALKFGSDSLHSAILEITNAVLKRLQDNGVKKSSFQSPRRLQNI